MEAEQRWLVFKGQLQSNPLEEERNNTWFGGQSQGNGEG